MLSANRGPMREVAGLNGLRHYLRLLELQSLGLIALISLLVAAAGVPLPPFHGVVWAALATCGVVGALGLRLFWQAATPALVRIGLAGLVYVYGRILMPSLSALAVACVLAPMWFAARARPSVDGIALALLLLPLGATLVGSVIATTLALQIERLQRAQLVRAEAALERHRLQASSDAQQRMKSCVQWMTGTSQVLPPDIIRGIYYPGLRASAWVDPAQLAWAKKLEGCFEPIREEALAALANKAGFRPENAYGDDRNWTSFALYRRYQRVDAHCDKCPITARLVDEITQGVCRDAMISVLGPNGSIVRHQDPDNLFLTCHLGLLVPPQCGIELVGEDRTWEEGKCLVFDSSFDHFAYNRSDRPRVILLLDFLNPSLDLHEKSFVADVLDVRMRAPSGLP